VCPLLAILPFGTTQAAEGQAVWTWAALGTSATDPNKHCSTRSSSGSAGESDRTSCAKREK